MLDFAHIHQRHGERDDESQMRSHDIGTEVPEATQTIRVNIPVVKYAKIVQQSHAEKDNPHVHQDFLGCRFHDFAFRKNVSFNVLLFP